MTDDMQSWGVSARSGSSGQYSQDYQMSVWNSEAGFQTNSVRAVAKFFFAPDLYLWRGRTTQILYLVLIVVTAMLIIYIELGMMANESSQSSTALKYLTEEIERFKSISVMEDIFSRERYALIQFVLANTRQKSAVLEQAWKNVYEASYTLIDDLPKWPFQDSSEFPEFTKNSRLLTMEVDGHRGNVKPSVNSTTSEMAYYSALLTYLNNAVAFSMRDIQLGSNWPLAASYFFLTATRKEVDRVRTIVPSGIYKSQPKIEGAIRVTNEASRIAEKGMVTTFQYLEMAMVFADVRDPFEAASNRECQICRFLNRLFDGALTLKAENFEIVNKSFYDWEARVVPIMDNQLLILDDYAGSASSQEQLIIVDIVITIFTTIACIFVAVTIWLLNQVFLEMRDRTDQLRDKTDEADNLLYQMLPVTVAKMLKDGAKIAPEYFEEATVYFNDVFGFHEFVSKSEPSKIVALLNNLYRSLDDRIELYGCYKVETVSDTYMVVAGVPKRRPDHAASIALMALDMIETAKTIPMGDSCVKIRVGLNTGPVFAGVVGLVMPRYCLFGDTVNTASRMESTSKPLHVHCSERTYLSLRKHGGFNFEFRGYVPVKGKGELKTYWLRSAEANTIMTASYGLEKPMDIGGMDESGSLQK